LPGIVCMCATINHNPTCVRAGSSSSSSEGAPALKHSPKADTAPTLHCFCQGPKKHLHRAQGPGPGSTQPQPTVPRPHHVQLRHPPALPSETISPSSSPGRVGSYTLRHRLATERTQQTDLADCQSTLALDRLNTHAQRALDATNGRPRAQGHCAYACPLHHCLGQCN
jgi:hypothetical protein